MWTGLGNTAQSLPLTQEVKCGTTKRGKRFTAAVFVLRGQFSAASQEMAASGVFLSLAVCFLLTQLTSAKNEAPCLPSKWNNGFKTFLRRHLPSGTPNSLNHDEWKKYIQSLGNCDRPTQSFLHPEDLERVMSVCSSRGGKVLKENMCISQEPFTFITVRSVQGTCGIKTVAKETKHLILACEVLENQCVPVHFEGNPSNLKPDNNAYSCQDPEKRNHAVSSRMTWLWLFVCLFIIYSL